MEQVIAQPWFEMQTDEHIFYVSWLADQVLNAPTPEVEEFFLRVLLNEVYGTYKYKFSLASTYEARYASCELIRDKALEKHQKELVDYLREVAEGNKSWRDFRGLACLHQEQDYDDEPNWDNLPASALAWQTKYRGNADKVFLNALADYNAIREEQATGENTQPMSVAEAGCLNMVEIVQSSGTGKSRLVYEAADTVFTIPMNLRPQRPSTSEFLFPDEVVHDLFSQTFSSFREAKIISIRFLGCIFKRVHNILVKKPELRVPIAWRDWLETLDHSDRKSRRNRDYFFDEVLHDFKSKDIEDGKKKGNGTQKVLYDQWKQDARDALSGLVRLIVIPTIPNIGWNEHHQNAVTLSRELPKVLLFIDESEYARQELIRDTEGRTTYSALTSAIESLKILPLLAVVTSTTPRLYHLLPSRSMGSTDVMASHDAHVPYWETPFDVLEERMQVGTLSLKDMTSVKNLAKFGRPLWESRYGSGVPATQKSLINFALQKLRNSGKLPPYMLNGDTNPLRRNADLAAFGVAALFEYELSHAAQLAQAELVTSHMRMVWSIHPTRELIITGYPCEPILAAATIHHLKQVTYKGEMRKSLTFVNNALMDRVIKNGSRGETVARLLLILTLVNAVDIPRLADEKDILPPIPSVSVKTFMQNLIPTNFHKFWESKPDRGGAEEPLSVGDAFNEAHVYFTHFVRYDFAPSAHHLWTAITRGQAIQCSSGQEGMDIIIPVALRPLRKVTVRDMSAILIRVSNRVDTVAVDIGCPDVKTLRWFESDFTPYISILLQLGPIMGQTEPRVSIPVVPEHPPSYTATESARYSMNLQGCSHKILGALRDSNYTYLFQEMLQSQDIFGSHPRQAGPSLRLLRDLKPTWLD